jgi:Domain of unknown function (DUF4395)
MNQAVRRLFAFGETVEGYPVKVINERMVRAAAGLLFFPAVVSFMHSYLVGNFQHTRLFVIVFLVDMALRMLNPRWAPSMIVGAWIVRHQAPEWVGAPQKRFAWGLGLLLGLAMLYLMVFNRYMGPLNMLICGSCLLLMFFEAAFGICLGCKLYNLFHREQAQLCPGGVCEVHRPAGWFRRHGHAGGDGSEARGGQRRPGGGRRALPGAGLRQGHRPRGAVEAAQRLLLNPASRGGARRAPSLTAWAARCGPALPR